VTALKERKIMKIKNKINNSKTRINKITITLKKEVITKEIKIEEISPKTTGVRDIKDKGVGVKIINQQEEIKISDQSKEVNRKIRKAIKIMNRIIILVIKEGENN